MDYNYFKTNILLIFLGGLATLNAQVVRIPDANFKQRIIALGHDTNDDGQIQVSEAQKVTTLYVDKLDIVNLEGINSFTNLEELGCHQNKLAALDVSKLKKLKFLYAFGNRIQKLNITGLSHLEHLYIESNTWLTSIDFTEYPKLTHLHCSNNRFTKLDVSGLSNLEELDAENNNLETVVLNKAPKLKTVKLKNNPLKGGTLDIRFLTYLEYLDLEGCGLVFINFSGTLSLKTVIW